MTFSVSCVWNQTFTPASATAAAKNGSIRRRSRHSSGRFHQRMQRSSAGSTTAEPFPNIASTNAAKLSQYQTPANSSLEKAVACVPNVRRFAADFLRSITPPG